MIDRLAEGKSMSEWRDIRSFDLPDNHAVDLWLNIYASPRSMGRADAFRVIDCWRDNGKWFHYDGGRQTELFSDYVTHWMPAPEPPDA